MAIRGIFIVVLAVLAQVFGAKAQTSVTNAGALDTSFDTSNGPLNWSVPQVHSAVWSILPLRNGQVLVGGPFLQVEGLDWAHLARLNADGSLDRTFTARPNAPVLAMAEQPDGKVVITGEFNGVDGQFRDRVARLEPDGHLDTNFAVRLGLNGMVRSLDLQPDGKVVIGGVFHVPRPDAPWIHNLVRLETNGAIDLTFDPGTNFFTTGINLNHVKAVLAQPDGTIFAGGTFSRASGSRRDYLARVRGDGTVDPRFGVEPLAGPNGPVYCVARQAEGLVLIGGSFTQVHDVARTNLARLRSDGSVDESFAWLPPPRSGFVSAVAADDGGRILVVYSSLDSSGNLTSSQILRYDARGRVDTNWASPVVVRSGSIAAIHSVVSTHTGRTYIGGTFETVDGVTRRRVALLHGDPPGPPIFTTQPFDVTAEPGADLILNASVTVSAPTAFQWYRNGEAISDGTSATLIVRYAMPVHSGPYWLVASNLYGATTSAVAFVTVLDPMRPGAVDLSFTPDPGANSNVWTVAETAEGQLVIGGDFTRVDGTDVTQIARLNSDGRVDETFRPTLHPLNSSQPTVRALICKSDGTLLAGGDLRAGGGAVWSSYFAKMRFDGSIDSSFNCSPAVRLSDGLGYPAIRGFVSSGDALFLGGAIFPNEGASDFRAVLRLYDNGTLDTRFKFGVQVFYPLAIAIDNDGQVLAGGRFVLKRVTPSGSWDLSFNVTVSKIDPCPGGIQCVPGTYNTGYIIKILVQPDGRLIIAGNFEEVNGLPRARVARLNPDGSVDPTFVPPVSSPNSVVYALALQADGKLLIGGTFTELGPVTRHRIARLNPDGSHDTTFDLGEGANGDVLSILLLSDGRIALGGRFTRFNGYPRGRLAIIHGGPVEAPTLRSTPTNFSIVAGRAVTLAPLVAGYPPPALQWLLNGVPISGETNPVLRIPNVQVGGSGDYSLVGSNASGVSTNLVANVKVELPPLEAGVLDPGFAADLGADGDINAIVVQEDGRILLGGSFRRMHGVPRAGIARLLSDGSLDTSFDPGTGLSEMPSNGVAVSRILLQPDGKIILGGRFGKFNGMARNGLVRLHTSGAVDLDYYGLSGAPLLIQPDGKLVLRGVVARLMRLHQDGTVDTSFGLDTNINNRIHAAALQPDGRILIVGDFYRNIARLMADGSRDNSFDPGIMLSNHDSEVCFAIPQTPGGASSRGSWELHSVVLQPDGRILIGGAFFAHGAGTQGNLTRLMPSGAPDPAFTQWGGPNFAVRTIAIQRDGRILVGGCFTSITDGGNHPSRRHVARLFPDGSVDPTFNPGAGFPGASDGWVEAIAIQPDGRIVLGGQFSHVDGAPRNNIARLGGDVQMFDPVKDGETFTTRITTMEGRIYWLETKVALSDGDWTVVTNVAGDGSVRTLTDTAAGNNPRFYRVRAE